MAKRIPYSLLGHGLTPVLYGALRVYLSVLRIHVEGERKFFEYLATERKAIAAVWHQRFLPALLYAAKYRDLRPCVMISQSRDGDLISPIAERLGLHPVRGSSSRGGKSALLTMVAEMERYPAAIHIVDGPRGPKGSVKAGLVRMAHLTGAAIFPIFISVQRAWIAKSWDRFLIPKPFTRVLIRWGDPMRVPRSREPEAFEAHRQEIEKSLFEGHAKDDLRWGWKSPL